MWAYICDLSGGNSMIMYLSLFIVQKTLFSFSILDSFYFFHLQNTFTYAHLVCIHK